MPDHTWVGPGSSRRLKPSRRVKIGLEGAAGSKNRGKGNVHEKLRVGKKNGSSAEFPSPTSFLRLIEIQRNLVGFVHKDGIKKGMKILK